ncbi:MAG: BACON domain-containing carbohydrate-binding protein, partial [Nitrospira sp.]
MATSSSQLGGFGATPTLQPTSSLLGATAQTSQAVAAPQASPMQTQPSAAPMRRLLSEIPGLKQLVAPSITISSPPSPKPAIGVSSSSFSFSLQQGAGSPTTQTLTVTNIGGGTLDWNAVSTAAWLNLSPASGKDTGTIALTATTGSLTAGPHNALITVSATNATPVSIPVTFTVTAPSPTLTVTPTAVTFSGVQGGSNPVSQSLTVNANGNWMASSSVPWLTLSPSSGSGNGSIAASVTLASAVVGPNQATITVTSGGVTRTTVVTLTVAATSLTASPSSLTYTATQGTANPAAQTITISANGAWTVSDNASWLSLSPATGSNNGTVTANVNTETATKGPNSTTITVTSGGISRTVSVTLTLNPPASSSVTLTWNGNTEKDLAGYKVYRATSSGAYGAPIAA